MESLDKLCDMLYKEIDEIAQKPSLSSGDLDTVHKLTDTVKNIFKIEMLDEEGQSESSYGYPRGTSYRGYSRDTAPRGYSRGMSSRRGYSGDGEWEAQGEYSRGRYSRDGGMSRGESYGRHYVRGHYSRDDVKDHMIKQLESMMGKANTEESRQALEQCMDALENS